MALPDPRALAGSILDGAYRVGEPIAQSEVATTFRGVVADTGAPITIHVHHVPSVLDARALLPAIERMRAEAEQQRMLAMLAPGIAQVHAVGIASGPVPPMPYRVSEPLEGGSLADFLRGRAGQSMPLTDAVALLGPVLEALVVAHEKGVTHGGITPFGVFLTADRQPKLVDFGVARALLRVASAFGLPLGLPLFPAEYGAAEHFEESRGPLGAPTDVAGAALLLLTVARGRPPREGDPASIREQALRSAPTPRALGLPVSESLEALFARSLALSPAVRPDGMPTFLREIRRPSIVPPATERTAKGTFIMPGLAPLTAPAIQESPTNGGRVGPHGTVDLSDRSEIILGQVKGVNVFGRTYQADVDRGGASPLSSTVRPGDAEHARQVALGAAPIAFPPQPSGFGATAPLGPPPAHQTPMPVAPAPMAPVGPPDAFAAAPRKSNAAVFVVLGVVGLLVLLGLVGFVLRFVL